MPVNLVGLVQRMHHWSILGVRSQCFWARWALSCEEKTSMYSWQGINELTRVIRPLKYILTLAHAVDFLPFCDDSWLDANYVWVMRQQLIWYCTTAIGKCRNNYARDFCWKSWPPFDALKKTMILKLGFTFLHYAKISEGLLHVYPICDVFIQWCLYLFWLSTFRTFLGSSGTICGSPEFSELFEGNSQCHGWNKSNLFGIFTLEHQSSWKSWVIFHCQFCSFDNVEIRA